MSTNVDVGGFRWKPYISVVGRSSREVAAKTYRLAAYVEEALGRKSQSSLPEQSTVVIEFAKIDLDCYGRVFLDTGVDFSDVPRWDEDPRYRKASAFLTDIVKRRG